MTSREDPIDVNDLRADEAAINAGRSDDQLIEAIRGMGE